MKRVIVAVTLAVSPGACDGGQGSSHAGETPNVAPPDATAKSVSPVAADGPAAPPKGEPAPPADRPTQGDAPVELGPLDASPVDVELTAADGVAVHGRYYGGTLADRSIHRDVTDQAVRAQTPLILLFHQAGANAAEYEPIAPRLVELGYAALAIDQRSGGRRFGRANRTVDGHGSSTGFTKAYPDLEAALAWAHAQGHSKVAAWGSSYTAALVFRLCAEHREQLAAVLAFSPGEYLGRKGMVADWAHTCTVPVFITAARGDEHEAAAAIADAVGDSAVHHEPKRGVHGSSTLRPDRNAKGLDGIWAAVESFLATALRDGDEPPTVAAP